MLSQSIPAICIDVDGVLKRGPVPIPGAIEAIKKLRKYKIPFSILTNGGGETEQVRAKSLSKLLQLSEKEKLKSDEVVLCHSPMKDVLKKYKNGTMLICGAGKIKEVMMNYGYYNFITTKEYANMYPEMFPFFFDLNRDPNHVSNIRTIVGQRLHRDMSKFPKIDAIVQITDITRWEINIQLFSDLLISNNGIPGTVLKANEPQKVDYHLACLDLLYMDKFPMPRFACGAAFYCLQNLFKLKYNRDIVFTDYGKPSKVIFNYARKKILQKNSNISNFYMIGDNPEVDIKGANESGFHSILVRTGIFKGINSKLNPAKKVVDDISKAVDYILYREGVKLL